MRASMLAFVLLAFAPQAQADLIVTPPGFTGTAGTTSNTGFLGSSTNTWQFQLAASQLPSLGAGSIITGLTFRQNEGGTTGPSSSFSFGDYEVTLAQATNTVATFSSTVADNMANPVQVLDGPLTIAANSFPGGSTPNNFGSIISFDTPYTYQGGDLVILLTHGSATGTLSVDSIATTSTAQGYGTLFVGRFGSGFQATTTTSNVSFPVLQFEFTSTAVPEPSSFALVGLVAVGFVVYRKRATQAVS